MSDEQSEAQQPNPNGQQPAPEGGDERPEAVAPEAATAASDQSDGDEGTAAPAAAGTEDELAVLRRERDEYLDQWRRTTADFQNFKKREERMRRERERAANAALLREMLPVMDDLGRGAAHVPEQLSDDDWVSGMLAIERKLMSILERHGVTTIESVANTPFDPRVHEAIVTQESDEVEQDHIVQELERGYRYHETVLRPARVIVAK